MNGVNNIETSSDKSAIVCRSPKYSQDVITRAPLIKVHDEGDRQVVLRERNKEELLPQYVVSIMVFRLTKVEIWLHCLWFSQNKCV